MARIEVEPGLSVHCRIDDFQFPWMQSSPVFMVHGFSRNASIWNRWMPQVTDAHRTYRLELRGCGDSDVPPDDYAVTLDLLFRDVIKVLDALGLDRVHYVGESSSGLFGSYFAVAHPERMASLTMCETGISMAKLATAYSTGADNAPTAIRTLGVAEWCRKTLGFRIDLNKAGPEMAEWYVRTLTHTPRHVAAAMMTCFSAIDLAPILSKIQCPTLLLSGDKSGPASVEDLERAQREIPQARLKIFPGYGHGIHVLQGEACAAEAVRFWKDVDAGTFRPG